MGVAGLFFRFAGGIQTQPLKPHPMQQYTLSPIVNPFEVAQRTFFNLQFEQDMTMDYTTSPGESGRLSRERSAY